jgi:Tol biopolymer transport system component
MALEPWYKVVTFREDLRKGKRRDAAGFAVHFTAATPGAPTQVYVVSSDGGGPQQRTTGENHGDPNRSPDGNILAFDRTAFLEPESPRSAAIYLLDLRTRKVSTLPGSEGRFFGCRWSPDGRYIFGVTGDGQKQALFDFTIKKKWVDLGDMPLNYPNWSCDGKYLYLKNSAGKN